MTGGEDPDQRWYGPIIIFLIVLALFAWAAALYRMDR